ncbi:MAG: hypothetical protein ACOC57_00940 [Acidobacteriota bacterium]
MPKVKLEDELYVLTPNEPGILGRVLGTLANSALNLKALCAFSQDNRGVFQIISSDNKKAMKCLKALGYEVYLRPVVTIVIDDRIGAGAEIGALLGNAAIDIKFCYGSSVGSGKALLVIHTDNDKKALQTLK